MVGRTVLSGYCDLTGVRVRVRMRVRVRADGKRGGEFTWSSVWIALVMSGSTRQLSIVQKNADMFDTTTN